MAATERRRDHRSAAWRYLALQIPGWLLAGLVVVGLVVWAGVPAWIAALVLAGFIGKDLLLYPVIRATFARAPTPPRPIGARGVAVEPLRPTGLIRVNGELWTARAATRPLDARTPVVVRGARGLTLFVDAADDRPEAAHQ